MSEGVRFFVIGEPKPAGSKATGVAHKFNPVTQKHEPVRKEDGRLVTFTKDSSGEAGKSWRQFVREAGQQAMADAELRPWDSPVRVVLVFHMPRLQGHFVANDRSRGLKASAPVWHQVRPDIDKLSRAVLDALKGVCWTDDNRIAFKHALKPYADPDGDSGVEVVVEPLNERVGLLMQEQLGQMELNGD